MAIRAGAVPSRNAPPEGGEHAVRRLRQQEVLAWQTIMSRNIIVILFRARSALLGS